MSRIIATLLSITVVAMSPISAQAQTGVERTSITVFYGDLDLSRPAGMQTLLRRVKQAGYQACGNSHPSLMTRGDDHRRCVNDAVANALHDIGLAGVHDRVAAEESGVGAQSRHVP